MTTDAAEHHGHEFSTPKPPSPAPALSFTRATFNTILSLATRQPVASGATETPTEESSEADKEQKTETATNAARAVLNTLQDVHSRPSSSSGSIVSAAETTRSKGRRRLSRPKTTYNLCHPPPASRQKQKLNLRPKVLLQLHRVTPSSRPRPAFEVLPSMRCAPKIVKTKFSRVLRALDRGPDDLVVMKAEQYGRKMDAESSDDEGEDRDAIGIICTDRRKDDEKSKTEIIMEDGSVWSATQMANGGYEFVTTDEHGLQLKARWVVRNNTLQRRDSSLQRISAVVNGTGGDDKRFTFSTISHGTRRHPIIATMTRQSIEVNEQYTVPTQPSSMDSPISTPIVTPSIQSEEDNASFISPANAEEKVENPPTTTHEALRRFILVTGIWVAFRENWSAVFRFADCQSPANTPTASPSRPNLSHRAASLPPIEPKFNSQLTSIDEETRRPQNQVRSGPGFLKRSSSTFVVSPPPIDSPTSPKPLKTRSRRSNSTGNASLNSKQWPGSHPLSEQVTENGDEDEKSLDLDLVSPTKAITEDAVHLSTREIVRGSDALRDSALMETLNSPVIASTPNSRIQSAYLLPESTHGLWDSAETEAHRGNGRKSKRRERPRSYHFTFDTDGESKKSSGGRFRKLFNVFRKRKE
jgi:hypothetical protein